jgi:hypothetical protein
MIPDTRHPGLPGFAATWIENWPAGLAHLSFPQRGLRLEVEEIHALGRRNGVHAHCFAAGSDQCLHDLEVRLDKAVRTFTEGAFIRLGSRSPKDTMLGVLTGCRAGDGAEALRLLACGSARVAFDLRRSLQARYNPWIFVRQWIAIPPETEFRCFMQKRRLAGVSQYYRDCLFPAISSGSVTEIINAALRWFFPIFVSQCPLEDVVFDLSLTAEPEPSSKLIELNPFGPPTDAALFSWVDADFDGTIRILEPGSTIALSLISF